MSALLDLLHKNETAVQGMHVDCREQLDDASTTLKRLDPWLGKEALIRAVEDELAKLRK